MLPVLTFGRVEVSTFVLMVSLGGLLGFWRTYRKALRTPAQAGALLTVTMVAFAAGLMGARGLTALLEPSLYADRPWPEWLDFWDRSGMALYGGMAAAALFGLAGIRLAGLAAWEVSDALVTAWAPSLVLVRLGCFLNGCCYGSPTTSPLGMVAGGSPNAVNFGIPSHPTQLYDAAALLALFLLLVWKQPRRAFAGQLTLLFLALYGSFRIYHETLRGDLRPALRLGSWLSVNFNQAASVLVLALVLGAYVALRRQPPAAAGAR